MKHRNILYGHVTLRPDSLVAVDWFVAADFEAANCGYLEQHCLVVDGAQVSHIFRCRLLKIWDVLDFLKMFRFFAIYAVSRVRRT